MSAQQLPLTRAAANQHRVIVTDGSAIAGADDSGLLYLRIQDTQGYSGHLLYLQDREEAIGVANALLAAVRAQDVAQQAERRKVAWWKA